MAAIATNLTGGEQPRELNAAFLRKLADIYDWMGEDEQAFNMTQMSNMLDLPPEPFRAGPAIDGFRCWIAGLWRNSGVISPVATRPLSDSASVAEHASQILLSVTRRGWIAAALTALLLLAALVTGINRLEQQRAASLAAPLMGVNDSLGATSLLSKDYSDQGGMMVTAPEPDYYYRFLIEDGLTTDGDFDFLANISRTQGSGEVCIVLESVDGNPDWVASADAAGRWWSLAKRTDSEFRTVIDHARLPTWTGEVKTIEFDLTKGIPHFAINGFTVNLSTASELPAVVGRYAPGLCVAQDLQSRTPFSVWYGGWQLRSKKLSSRMGDAMRLSSAS